MHRLAEEEQENLFEEEYYTDEYGVVKDSAVKDRAEMGVEI